MRKAERLFKLANLIRQHQPVKAEKLADLLQVSVRSVYRYIDDLSSSDIPIYEDGEAGYCLHDGFELPPLTLTNDEMDALLLAVEMLSVSRGKRLPIAAHSLLNKIHASIPHYYNQQRQNGLHAVALADSVFQSELWNELLNAIQTQLTIKITYNYPLQQESEREVSPLGLFYWNGRWTLAAWCKLREDYRSFRLDRIADVTVSDQRFSFTPTINLSAFVDYQNEQFQYLQ